MRTMLDSLHLWLPGVLAGMLLAAAVLVTGNELLPDSFRKLFSRGPLLFLAAAILVGSTIGLVSLFSSSRHNDQDDVSNRNSSGGTDVS